MQLFFAYVCFTYYTVRFRFSRFSFSSFIDKKFSHFFFNPNKNFDRDRPQRWHRIDGNEFQKQKIKKISNNQPAAVRHGGRDDNRG